MKYRNEYSYNTYSYKNRNKRTLHTVLGLPKTSRNTLNNRLKKHKGNHEAVLQASADKFYQVPDYANYKPYLGGSELPLIMDQARTAKNFVRILLESPYWDLEMAMKGFLLRSKTVQIAMLLRATNRLIQDPKSCHPNAQERLYDLAAGAGFPTTYEDLNT